MAKPVWLAGVYGAAFGIAISPNLGGRPGLDEWVAAGSFAFLVAVVFERFVWRERRAAS